MSDEIDSYLSVVFGSCPNQGFVNLRGIGEKGTPQEGKFREDIFIDLAAIGGKPEALVAEVSRHVARWNENGIGSFIVPAILSAPKGEAKNVQAFGSIVVDIDSGDIPEKMIALENTLGPPTAVVYSGGVTAEGHQKRHAYWTLDNLCQDITGLIKLRHRIALGGGGDMMFGLGVASNPFGRAHQPVRIAGSVHNKNSKRTPVTIQPISMHSYQVVDLIVAADHLPLPADMPVLSDEPGAAQEPREPLAIDEKVHAGGEGTTTRWATFNRVAGYYISLVRKGDYTIDQAKELARTWVELNMIPPWSQATFQAEFAGLLNKDRAEKGEILEVVYHQDLILKDWVVRKWDKGPLEPRRFLVSGLVMDGKHQLLVAEGGAGKTFLMLDLAIKVATWKPGCANTWLGHKVNYGGTVVYMTTEDDREELRRRMNDIDPDNTRAASDDKLIIIPLIEAGGSFALVEKDPRTGSSTSSERWKDALKQMAAIPDLKLFMLDTLNSTLHGEENAAIVINEFVRELTKVRGATAEMPTILVSHHIRKQGDEPIRNGEDMLASIRGSSALPAAFRAVIGMWHCSDYDRRMGAMDMPSERGMLYKMAIVKKNNPDMLKGELTLHRQPCGLLADVTSQDRYSSDNYNEQHAWLFAAIQEAATAGHPYSREGKNSKSGLYLRRNELPSLFSHTGPGEFARLVDHLLMAGELVATAAKGGRDKKWLDVPNGPISGDNTGAELNSGAYEPPIWRDWIFDASNNSCRNKYPKK
jgi:KaiC/GvpD/RAD55 family RecA-like ATPase